MNGADLAERFRSARGDPQLAVLEGFHPLKHALRFEAEVVEAVSPDPDELQALARELAPDLVEAVSSTVRSVDGEEFRRLAPVAPATGVIALARRPDVSVSGLMSAPGPAPVVFLHRPVHQGNVGAAIRVAAAAGAAGMLTSGRHDPWGPEAIRGAAGLQFALPVAAVDSLASVAGGDRPVVAVDPGGEELTPGAVPPRSLLVFGTERHGLDGELLEAAGRRLRIPMRDGVSSLNLATAVAVVLYAWRFGRADGVG